MEGMELTCFQIISFTGTARSIYIEAIEEAKKGNIEKAKQMIKEGEDAFNQGHEIHTKMIQEEANGKSIEVPILLVHAEDQLMSAESFKILANQFIDLYEKLLKNNISL